MMTNMCLQTFVWILSKTSNIVKLSPNWCRRYNTPKHPCTPHPSHPTPPSSGGHMKSKGVDFCKHFDSVSPKTWTCPEVFRHKKKCLNAASAHLIYFSISSPYLINDRPSKQAYNGVSRAH